MSIILPFKKQTGVDCAYCPRVILKRLEVRGRLFKVNDKPMCPVCRATKLSRLKGQIEADKPKFKEDIQKANKTIREKEIKRIEDNQHIPDIAKNNKLKDKK